MKKYAELMIYLAVFVFIIVGAVFGYKFLAGQGTQQNSGSFENQNPSSEVQKAPDFTVYGKDNAEFTLSDIGTSPAVLNFWATWCGPCRSEMPAFEKMYHKYKDKVCFVMINVEGDGSDYDKIREFVDAEGYTFPFYTDIDMSASYAYGARSIPLSVFIDSDGNVSDVRVGAMSEAELDSYIKKLLED